MRALDRLRDAFYWRRSPTRPTAADYALGEACEVARQRNNAALMKATQARQRSYFRCAL